MKHLISIFLLLATTIATLAQSPQAFKFQAVIRNGDGILISNQTVGVKISILEASIEGPSVYTETHTTTSNENGVIILNIGEGLPSNGSFGSIGWGAEDHFVKIELDQKNTGAFEAIGVSQLLSVPYALYAQHSGDDDWTNVANGIVYQDGKVGIGNTNPKYNLDVTGTINANTLLVNGNTIAPGPWLNQSNNIYYNTGSVGIGTATPATKLEINGGSDLNLLNLRNQNNSLGVNTYVSSNIDFHGSALIGRRSRGTYLSPQTVLEGDRISGVYGSIFTDGAYQNSSAVHFYVGPNPGIGSYPSNIRFETTASGEIDRKERMRITDNGDVEIKSGDIYIENINSGVIMKSPNGQCWRMTVDNSGNPVFNSTTCPN